MIRRMLGVVFFGGLFIAGYVLVNGLDRTYEVFGASGLVLSGGSALLGSLAASAGVFLLRVGILESTHMVEGPGGGPELQTLRTYRPGLITVAILLGVVASVILISAEPA